MSIQLDLFDHAPVVAPITGPAMVSAAPQSESTQPGPAKALPPLAPRHPPTNLFEVLQVLEADEEVALKNREVRSAIRSMGKVLGLPLAQIPAAPAELGVLVEKAMPAMAGVKPARWARVTSLVRQGLKRAGIEVMPGRAGHDLAPEWAQLLDALPSHSHRYGLSRVLRHFTRLGVLPAAVSLADFEGYRKALKTTAMEADGEAAYGRMSRHWNAAVGLLGEWPKLRLSKEGDHRRYAMAWDEFPPAFVADVERFLTHAGDQDPFAENYARSVKPSTIETRRGMLQQVATGLVQSGFPIADLKGLQTLTEPENARRALRHLRARAEGGDAYRSNQAQLLCTIARHWLRREDDAVQLSKMASGLRAPKVGMTEKNRNRLRQFELERNVMALLMLPEKIRQQVKATDVGGRGPARRVMMALLVELLLMAPLRIDNYASLEIGRHVVDLGKGKDRKVHIVIPGAETKTGKPFEATLPASTVALLDSYLNDYRRRLTAADGPYLFPGWGGTRRSTDSLSYLLSQFIRRETGIVMHAHLFRHLAGFLYLRENPEGIETIRQLLGHTTVRTTLRNYAEIEARHAVRRYDEVIAALKTPSASRRKGGR